MTPRTRITLAAATLTLAVTAQDPRPVLIEASRVHISPTTTLTGADARFVVRGGRIAAVGREIPAELARSARRVQYEDGVVTAGIVLPHHDLRLGNDLAETIDAFTPELRTADAFDPWSKELTRLAHTGVTSVALAPLSKNTFGGIAAIVRPGADAGDVVSADSYLKIALVAESLDQNRYPTSRMGAVDLIRGAFQDAANPLAIQSPPVMILRSVAGGARPVAMHANTHAEITCALDVAADLQITPMLFGASELTKSVERLKGSGITVALAPLSLGSKQEHMELPAKLEAAGIPFSFMAYDGNQARLSAAIAVRHGLSRETARAAITTVPAAQCGLAERAGSLTVGRNADFVVYDGDPVDLTSRQHAVWINGSLMETQEGTR